MTTKEYNDALSARRNCYVPACGGTETPFRTRSGVVLLYCYNPATGEHAYVDVVCDMVLTNDDAFQLLNG